MALLAASTKALADADDDSIRVTVLLNSLAFQIVSFDENVTATGWPECSGKREATAKSLVYGRKVHPVITVNVSCPSIGALAPGAFEHSSVAVLHVNSCTA